MCSGNIACKSCSRKSAVRGIGRRRKSKNSSIKALNMKKLNLKNFQPALEVAGGLVVSKFINTLPIPFINNNPTFSAGAKIALGLLFGSRSGTVGNIATGVMVGGITDAIEKYLPSLTPGGGSSSTGVTGLLAPRRREAIAGQSSALNGINCPVSETAAYA